jgi:hypothetical protein
MRASLPVFLTTAALFGGCVLLGLVAPQSSYRSLFQENETPKPTESCAKYEERGIRAVRGCEKCAAGYPGRVDECMTCGGACFKKVCDGPDVLECLKTDDFRECHRACMQKTEDEEPLPEHGHPAGKCEECIAAGQDYCIAENRCTTRATRTCRGPEDHITGCPKFAQTSPGHSMTCPRSVPEEAQSAQGVSEPFNLALAGEAFKWSLVAKYHGRFSGEDHTGRVGRTWILHSLSLADDDATEFVFEGPKDNCIIRKVGDKDNVALEVDKRIFEHGTPVWLWNDAPAVPAEAHSRFALGDDGRITAHLSTPGRVGEGDFVLGIAEKDKPHAGKVTLVPRGYPTELIFRSVPVVKSNAQEGKQGQFYKLLHSITRAFRFAFRWLRFLPVSFRGLFPPS